ncbi:MAG: type II 3-dehydroquinate dehydratase [Rhodobacteraceae bacterium]|nr:type II 3-dehydroquinate dehydratase [Paracoccaceae bacterium]
MNKPILVVNGPNLNMLGTREPRFYGTETLADVERACQRKANNLGLGIRFFQSNHEGALIDAIQAARETTAAIVINAGAYAHTSVGILDALNIFAGPVIEVHISNIHAREDFRHHSRISVRADGLIAGCGTQGYLLALIRLGQILQTG